MESRKVLRTTRVFRVKRILFCTLTLNAAFFGARSLRIDEWMRFVRELLVSFMRSLKMSFAVVRAGGGWVRCRAGK